MTATFLFFFFLDCHIFLVREDLKKKIPPRHRGLGGKYSLRVFTWMRKVVGLNPDDDLYRIVSFSFAEFDWKETATRSSSDWNVPRLRDCWKRQAMRLEARGDSNQPSLNWKWRHLTSFVCNILT